MNPAWRTRALKRPEAKEPLYCLEYEQALQKAAAAKSDDGNKVLETVRAHLDFAEKHLKFLPEEKGQAYVDESTAKSFIRRILDSKELGYYKEQYHSPHLASVTVPICRW